MPEPKVEKKINGKDGSAEFTEREKKLLNDLKARHAEEMRAMQMKSTENEKKLINDLTSRYAEERNIFQAEIIENSKILVSDLETRHAQELQRALAESTERERKLLNDYKAEHQARSISLIMALLRTRSERDRLFLAFSWVAVLAIVVLAFRGLMDGPISKVFMIAALGGFFGAIIFAKRNLKKNNDQIKHATDGTVPLDPIWQEDDNRPSRFLVLGLILSVLLGSTLFINSAPKGTSPAQEPQPTDQNPGQPQVQAAKVTPAQGDLGSSASVPVLNKEISSAAPSTPAETTPPKPAVTASAVPSSKVNTNGNGGNFVNGSSR